MIADPKPSYMSKIKIELTECFGIDLDDLNETTVTIESEMLDCSIHAWFKLFEKILRYSHFSESVIMRGAVEMAFNDSRSMEQMKLIADAYDLVMKEYEEEES